MASDIAATIRNVILGITLLSFGFAVFLFLLFGAHLNTTQADAQIERLPEIIMRSQMDAFLSQDFSALQTTVDNLSDAGRDAGIAYIGFTDENGRMFSSGMASEFPEEVSSTIRDERLVNIEDNLIIPQEETVRLSDGTRVREILRPVRQSSDAPTYGAVKIGLFESSFTRGWGTYRNRVIIATVLFVLFSVIIILLFAQRWRRKIEEVLNTKEASMKDHYEQKIEEIEQETSSGPLSPDEFFEIIDFSKKLTKSLQPVDVLRYLVNSTVRILNVKQVVVFLLSPDDSSVLIGQMGMKEGDWMDRDRLQQIEIEVGSGEIGTIAELGQTNILDKPSPGAGVAGALRAGGETIGVIRATEKKTGARMSNKDKLKTRLLCQISGEVIAHSFEYQELLADAGRKDGNSNQ